ncbi:MOSC domain-containing protein [uncultured Maricaulis sp.]|jgi:MOSC domain-containing protein|uniref:MOSC domain-containing protein n=1 Tax=uncultured Maricaulis sp. TaxID=174710 RepID=UPI0025FB920F|nr:MOSC domain-containing protein [uncultured Maricaulis sp.]
MPQLTAITRFPIKGLGPDSLDRIALEANKTLHMDRAHAIENGPSPFNDAAPGHVKKKHFLMLAGQAGLARLNCRYREKDGTYSVNLDGAGPITILLDNPATHTPLLDALRALLGEAIRGPLRLVHAPGQAMTDISQPQISLINAASVRDVSEKAGHTLDPLRFRGNLLIDGLAPWEEFDLIGHEIRIGGVTCRVESRIRRCVATSVDPQRGALDTDVPAALFEHYGHMDCGIYLSVLEDGEIALGDPISLA